jgi:glutamine cyclotransferase
MNVTLAGQSLERLNELEWAEGAIYANVWQTDQIVKIDPQSGKVIALIQVQGLLTHAERARADVLNGIAFNSDRNTFLITGKYWPTVFEVAFVPGAHS